MCCAETQTRVSLTGRQMKASVSMASRLEYLDTDLGTDIQIGDWFTIDDEFESQPSFLRDHDETYFRAHRQDSCPPPGVPMKLISRHENYLYASAMCWNGEEWCPAIVDQRRHAIVRLPDKVPDSIKAHIQHLAARHHPYGMMPTVDVPAHQLPNAENQRGIPRWIRLILSPVFLIWKLLSLPWMLLSRRRRTAAPQKGK